MARRNSRKTSWKDLFKLPAFLFANIAILAVIGISTARETYRGWNVDKEIHALEAEAVQLEGRRMKLESLAENLLSEEHVELEARSRLGRQKPGERVVVLYGMNSTHTWSGDDVFGTEARVEVKELDLRTNPEKWIDYFKGKK